MLPLHAFDEAGSTLFAELENLWAQDYPGQSHSARTFRHDVVVADVRRRQTQSLVEQLEGELRLTGLPCFHWDQFTRRYCLFFEKRAAWAQREFRRAFQLLHSLKSSTTHPPPAKPVPEPERPNSEKAQFDQNVRVTVAEDGRVVTQAEPDAAFFLRPEVQALGRSVRRHYYFKDKIVPEAYAFVFEHDGVSYEPAHHVYITYFEEDFRAICQREIDKRSEYLLDGPRRDYFTHTEIPYVEPVYPYPKGLLPTV